MVHEQQRLCQRRLRSYPSGWLELGSALRSHRASQSKRQRTQVHVSGSSPACSNQSRNTGLAALGAFAPAGILQGEPGLLSGAASLPAKMRLAAGIYAYSSALYVQIGQLAATDPKGKSPIFGPPYTNLDAMHGQMYTDTQASSNSASSPHPAVRRNPLRRSKVDGRAAHSAVPATA